MLFFKKKTKIQAYALVSKEVKNKFLTITKDPKEAEEYAMMLLRIKHYEHFKSWCDLRELDSKDFPNWLKYYTDCVPSTEKQCFQIVKIKYELSNILAILRMFGNCLPLGCSFDTELEYAYFNAIIDEPEQQKQEETNSEDVDKKDTTANVH